MLISKCRGAAAPPGANWKVQEYDIPVSACLHELQPERIDLVEQVGCYDLWPASMQGERNTCVAFAVAACLELLRARDSIKGSASGSFELLSPQFLYWFMRKEANVGNHPPPGWKGGATKLAHARQVLEKHGICKWSLCPYEAPSATIEGPEPTEDAQVQAKGYVINQNSCEYLDRPTPADKPGLSRRIYDLLDKGRPVAIAVPVFYLDATRSVTNWEGSATAASGKIRDPEKGMKRPIGSEQPAHAVCIVGFQADPGEAVGGWFIFRNSRGLNWGWYPGKTPVHPALGYGAISATYIERYCWEMLSPEL